MIIISYLISILSLLASGQSSLIFAVEPGDRKGRHYISALKPIWTDY